MSCTLRHVLTPVTSLLQLRAHSNLWLNFVEASVEKKSTGSALQVDQDASLQPCCWFLSTRERWEAQVQPCV